MKLLENILLATDFSKSSDDAVKNAIVLAKKFQSKITLVHVLPNYIRNEKAKFLLNKEAKSQLDVINSTINNAGVKTHTPIIKYGSYCDNIVKSGDKINADLIMVGSGEKSKNNLCQLGTTAETIIRKSNKPIWVVKKGSVLSIKTILCPVDFYDESKCALKNAISIAQKFKAKLVVFNVYEVISPESLRPAFNWDELNQNSHTRHLKEFNLFLTDFNLTDLNLRKKIQGGIPDVEILKAIKKYNSDLLIMGASGKTGLSRMIIGSVTEKVIREVPCSFITLKS